MNPIRAAATWNASLCGAITPIDAGLWRTFYLPTPHHVFINAHVGLKHRGNYVWHNGIGTGVGWGLRGALRGPLPSEAALNAQAVGVGMGMPAWLIGCKDAGNLTLEEHYATAVLTGYALLQPGWYRFEVWGLCHGSSAGPPITSVQSAVEINGEGGAVDPYNNALIDFREA